MMAVPEIIKKCRTILEGYYGSQFKGVVLYGSTGRKQSRPGSDIDLLVLLEPPFDYFLELHRIVELLYPIQLESEQLLSAKPAPRDDFEHGSILLYRNALREGVRV